MAALRLTDSSKLHLTEAELAAVYRHCGEYLTAYATPRFLRLQTELNMTATFKQQKFTLTKEGFDPNVITRDLLYFLDAKNKTYSPLNAESFDAISKGQLRM